MTGCFRIFRYLLFAAIVSQHFAMGQQVPTRKIHVHREIHLDKARNFTLDNGSDSTYDVQVKYLPDASMLDGLRLHYCYVDVKVFKSSVLKYPANNVSVFALVIDPTQLNDIMGYTTAQTDSNGNACVRTICRKNAIIFVDTGIERLHLAANQLVPSQLSKTSLSETEILLKHIHQIPAFFHPPGPVYTNGFLYECKNPQPLAYHIGFHFLGPPDEFKENTNASKFSYDESWYPLREGEPGYKVCYIKVKVKTPIYNVSIKLESYNNQSNFYYGSMTSGPKEDPKAGNIVNRAACIEYRCPYEDPSSGKIIATRLEGKLTVPKSVSCKKSNISPDFQSDRFNITNSSFEISLTPHDDYGPNAGIYFNRVQKVAKSLCFTGANEIIDNYEMNPDTGYAFQFTCESNLPSDSLLG